MSHTRFNIKNISGEKRYIPFVAGGKEKHAPVEDNASVVSEEVLDSHFAGETAGTLELSELAPAVGAPKALKDVLAVSPDATDLATAQTLVNELKGIANNMNA